MAFDSFKESIAASEAGHAFADGWTQARPQDRVLVRPIADGGEGTLAAVAQSRADARRHEIRVSGPDGLPVLATWLELPGPSGSEGVVELANTSGIELLGSRRLPWDADTFGFGQAIAAALDAGMHRLTVGIGSSASTDCGAGMLAALGARITDADGRAIRPGARGLSAATDIDTSGLRPLPEGGVRVLTDVSAPLTGPRGAAAAFASQKGFQAHDIPTLEAAIVRFARLLDGEPESPGAGAAGGTGYALAHWGARLVAGAEAILALLGADEDIAEADFVVTGEGCFDAQSRNGKGPGRVLSLAATAGVPAAVVAGIVSPEADTECLWSACSLVDVAGSMSAAIADPETWLRSAGADLAARYTRDAPTRLNPRRTA